jgi:HlyD family secretion protein
MNNTVLNRRNAIVAGVVVAAMAALAWAFAPRPVEVETAVVERGHFEQSIEEDGRTRLKDRYTISAPVAARLARITLREGDRVATGDPVAVLSPVMSAMVDERSTRESRSRLEAARANVSMAGARLERARVARQEAELELQRHEKLAREGFVSTSRLDSARLGVDGALREYEAAAAARDAARHESDMAAAALQPVTGATGRPFVLRSPVAGVVLRVPLQSEGTVAPGTALLEVGEPSRMEVIAQLLTTDAIQAAPGTRAMIERWGGPPVEGRVVRVEPAAFTKVSALGIEEQRVNVVIDVYKLPDEWRSMGDGFRVTVRVITASVDNAVLVPVGALFPFADGGMAVYRVDEGRASLQSVQLAGRNGSVGSVTAGLQPGQSVVVYPPPALADGKRVRIRKP